MGMPGCFLLLLHQIIAFSAQFFDHLKLWINRCPQHSRSFISLLFQLSYLLFSYPLSSLLSYLWACFFLVFFLAFGSFSHHLVVLLRLLWCQNGFVGAGALFTEALHVFFFG